MNCGSFLIKGPKCIESCVCEYSGSSHFLLNTQIHCIYAFSFSFSNKINAKIYYITQQQNGEKGKHVFDHQRGEQAPNFFFRINNNYLKIEIAGFHCRMISMELCMDAFTCPGYSHQEKKLQIQEELIPNGAEQSRFHNLI